MFKRAICLLLMLCLVISLAACGENPKNDSTTPKTDDEPKNEIVVDPDGYKDIECDDYDDYTERFLCFRDSKTVVSIALPEAWELNANADGGFDIICEGATVGSVRSKAEELGVSLNEEKNEFGSPSVSYEIVQNTSETYLKVFTYSYTDGYGLDRQIQISIDYARLSSFGATKLMYNGKICDSPIKPNFNMLEVSDEERNAGLSVLILGNSFISTSDIGIILRQMLPSNCRVSAISRGYATVNGTYSKDEAILDELRRGDYDILFLCGFFSSADADAAKILMDACEIGGAKLVIFPAHNEKENAISTAVTNYKKAYFINWKNELNALIENGVARSELAMNDTHGHSTALAGYVGAHMIYRAIYGEVPPALEGYYDFDQAHVDSILGEYAATATVQTVDPDKILYLGD